MNSDHSVEINVGENQPDFTFLPWNLPLQEWLKACKYVEELPRGLSRHTVIFIRYQDQSYAFKQLPSKVAKIEYENLVSIHELRLPVVVPIGYAKVRRDQWNTSVLITKYLEHSLPYRSLFISEDLSSYRNFLLDAIAGLLVQLHLKGIFWGDCSLSNTLFRRDAGYLKSYLVDAETSSVHPSQLTPIYRYEDLKIMEENLDRDIYELESNYAHIKGFVPKHTGDYVKKQYHLLWEEITKDTIITPGDQYHIQERIRALNRLGFSVGEIGVQETAGGMYLKIHVVVTDRNYHSDQLCSLTNLCTEEMQAQKLINEIHELKLSLSHQSQKEVSMEFAAQSWLEMVFQPVVNTLRPYFNEAMDPIELYCQVLENKWYLSERAQYDVGHEIATQDYIHHYLIKNTNPS